MKLIIITPEVLSEVSNYAHKLDQFSDLLKENIEYLNAMREIYVSKETILESYKEVLKFGFTDTSLIIAAKNNSGEILTRDYELSQYCKNELGIGSYNLEDILGMKEFFKSPY